MLHRTKVIDLELSREPTDIAGLDGYAAVRALVRLHGVPLGYVEVPVVSQSCSAVSLRRAVVEQLTGRITRHLLDDLLRTPQSGDTRITDLCEVSHPAGPTVVPLVTVAVCTRDRTDNLDRCLEALCQIDYPALDLLVIDNAPSSSATADLVRSCYPNVRYVVEATPGLDWARNRAIVEARGEIVAFTDDDAAVDPGWVAALVSVFVEDPDVAAVTGLVVPYELETHAQLLFEHYGGFGRGFERKRYSGGSTGNGRWIYGTGQLGTGANMAFRRAVFERIGLFDPALDVGTVTNGGGDLEMFFRVQREGFTLVYEPRAIVRHRHRREYVELRTQLANNGVGLYSYLVRTALAYPDERLAVVGFGLWWLWRWSVRRLVGSWIRPRHFPRDLILVEMWGAFVGLTRYQKARRIAENYAPPPNTGFPMSPAHRAASSDPSSAAVAIRTVDLDKAVEGLSDVGGYESVQLLATRSGRPLGCVEIAHQGGYVSAPRMRDALIDGLGFRLLGGDLESAPKTLWAQVLATVVERRYVPSEEVPVRLAAEVTASIVVATYDRPADLRECLQSLTALETHRRVEIVVVDNHPASGLTAPVVADFPGVVLVSEPRKGLSYARNAGILASRGEIVVATDDDVTMPAGWLERILAPFARSHVGVVTGNVLPRELDTRAQQLFEAYGGLGRGFERREFAREWFEAHRRHAVPTWELGATANAAFRASVFANPEIGLFDEALSTGTSAGGGEDIDLFYRALKTGYTIVYEPAAYVWHRHRREMADLRRQIYNYSKGHVGYHLTTLFRHGDRRALLDLALRLPRAHLWRVRQRLQGRSEYPISLLLLEVAGNLAGPWGLWQSRRRIRREGRSGSYMPAGRGRLLAMEALAEPSRQYLNADVA